MRQWTEKLLDQQYLTESEAESVAEVFAEGAFDPVEATAFLVAQQALGYSGEELAGFARVFRARMTPIASVPEDAVDTCGTGGGLATWNLSTATALVLAGAGVPVAKHGNRAVTSRCGSADVLEALGVRLDTAPEACWEKAGIAFLFAPSFHPAFRHVGPLRRQIGVRTLFNLLGPLLNPAKVRRQVIGVFRAELIDPMAAALVRLGVDRAIVAHGEEGLDEVSPVGATRVAEIGTDINVTRRIGPHQFGLDPLEASVLEPGITAEENAAKVLRAITEADSPEAKAVLPSAAAGLWVAGRSLTLAGAVEVAKHAIESGAAKGVLERWVEVSQKESPS